MGRLSTSEPGWKRDVRKARAHGEVYQAVEDLDGDGFSDIAVGVSGKSPRSIDQAGFIRFLSGRDGSDLPERVDGPAGCQQFGTRMLMSDSHVLIGSPRAEPPMISIVPRVALSSR